MARTSKRKKPVVAKLTVMEADAERAQARAEKLGEAQVELTKATSKPERKAREPKPEPKAEAVDPKTFWVYSPTGAPFSEFHPDHPGGEVWVAGNEQEPSKPVLVARTAAVELALKNGRLAFALGKR